MTKVQLLREEIEKLDHDEFAELRDWINERDWEQWDREIEEDSASGKLHEIVKEAREAHRRGREHEVLNLERRRLAGWPSGVPPL